MSGGACLYVLMAEGVARRNLQFADGLNCTLLLLQKAISPEDAQRRIAGVLWDAGWERWAFISTERAVVDDPEAMNGELRAAMTHALRHGSAIVAYPPDPH